jgi:hypothetical protein
MKHIPAPLILLIVLFSSCHFEVKTDDPASVRIPIAGTWRLFSGITITKGDSVLTDYTKDQSMIKIINDTHFAFLKHDLAPKKDSSNHFDAGGGSYTLTGNQYTEHLDYYIDHNWEAKTFNFTITISNDTLIQKGLEKVEGAGVDREIIEKYVRVK